MVHIIDTVSMEKWWATEQDSFNSLCLGQLSDFYKQCEFKLFL